MSSSTATTAAAASAPRQYKFYPSDFGPLEARPQHLELTIDTGTTEIRVINHSTFIYHPTDGHSPLTVLKLNARDLDVHSVERVHTFTPLGVASNRSDFVGHVASFADARPLDFHVDKDNHFLVIQFGGASGAPIQPQQEFVLRLVTTARPTEHILEGFYFDALFLPSSCPRTIITQCQQYGFQRITPCTDYMSAKAYYTTTIIADKRYTTMITNGDLAPGHVDAQTGRVCRHPHHRAAGDEAHVPAGVERESVRYHNHITNMAPYLFFYGVGTYETYTRELEYPDGDSFALELLVFPNLVKPEHARVAVDSLHDSVMWVYLSTGPEAYEHEAERKELYALIREREQLKRGASGASAAAAAATRLAEIRARCKVLIGAWRKTGYKYTGRIYREIAMQNSDYGGMENVGNTTIVSSRLVPSDQLTDPAYIYMEGVKVHEYYHNINGSEVTGFSPFELWLNEAVTVHVQNQREDDLFGADFMRLKTVLYSFMPGQGPLAVDASANSMAIEPEGYNRVQELISAMTYSKAPEFVRMVEMLMTKPVFNRGLDLYHTRYRYGNATARQWIEAMEEASGLALQSMADKWLRRTGYPTVTFTTEYDAAASVYRVSMQQTCAKKDGEPWDFPVSWALVRDGRTMHEGVYRFDKKEATLVISDVEEKPDYLSFARGWSFFGRWIDKSATPASLRLQALTDPDPVNRYFAYRAFVDDIKAQLIESLIAARASTSSFVIPPAFAELHGTILFDSTLNPSTRALLLREVEQISRPELEHRYWEIAHAKTALRQAVWDAHAARIVALYEELEAKSRPGPHMEGLHDRALKHHLYAIMSSADLPTVLPQSRTSPATVKVNTPQYALNLIRSPFMTDRSFGLISYLSGPASAGDKAKVKEQTKSEFAAHPDSIEEYIACIANVDSDDAPALIRDLLNDASLFNVNLAGHARSIARGWSVNRKRSVLTTEGLALTEEMFARIGAVNQMSAQSLLHMFNDVPKLIAAEQEGAAGAATTSLSATLQRMRTKCDPVQHVSLFNQLTVLLRAAGVVV